MEEHNSLVPVSIYFSAGSDGLSKPSNIFSKEILGDITSDNIIEGLYVKKKSAKLLVNNFIATHQDTYEYNLINLEQILGYRAAFAVGTRYKYIYWDELSPSPKN